MADHDSSSFEASLSSCLFSCRIVDIYSTLISPIMGMDVSYSEFSSSPIKKVPVIKIFGSTPAGQKCCVHVHGAFPYLYVPCTSDNPSDRYLSQLGQSIDHALNVSLGSPPDEHHVFKISVVTGIPFYGYHSKARLFAKIYLYNPANIKRLSDLLLSSAIMNSSFQPHESHIPFPLQFMIDYNLFGMNFIHTSQVKFRVRGEFYELDRSRRSLTPSYYPPPLSPSTSLLSSSSVSSVLVQPSSKVWNIQILPDDMLTVEDRVSCCELEVDVLAADIVNREDIEQTSGRFPGLVALWEEEQARRETLGLEAAPLSQPLSPDRICSLVHSAERRFKDQLDEIIGPPDTNPSNTGAPPSSLQSSSSFPLSQSCEVEVHEPVNSSIKLEDHSVSSSEEVIVDEQLVHRKNEIQNKLSKATIDTSDTELLEMLTELAGQSSQATPPVSPMTLPSPSSSCISSHNILSQVLHSVTRSSSRTISSDSSSVTASKHQHQDVDTNTKEHGHQSEMIDYSSQTKDNEGNDIRGGERSPLSVSSSLLESSIPCNQYVDNERSRDDEGSGMDWLNRSNRSHTPVILDELVVDQPSQELPSSQYPTRQLSFQEKQQLIRLCSDISKMDDEEVDQVEKNVFEGEYYDDVEMESMMMSQVMWNENETEQELEREPEDFIPQLDGTGDKPNKKTDTRQRLSLKSKTAAARRQRRKSKQSISSDQYSTCDMKEMEGSSSSTSMETAEPTCTRGRSTSTDSITEPPSPTQMKRALSGSFVPLVRKLSKEDIEKYTHKLVTDMTTPTQPVTDMATPTQSVTNDIDTATPTQLFKEDVLSIGSTSLSIGMDIDKMSSSTPVPQGSKRKRFVPVSTPPTVRRSLRLTVADPILLTTTVDEPMERAIYESLKTYQLETTVTAAAKQEEDNSTTNELDTSTVSTDGPVEDTNPHREMEMLVSLPQDMSLDTLVQSSVTTANETFMEEECVSEDDIVEYSQLDISSSMLDVSGHDEEDEGQFQLKYITTDSEDSETETEKNKFRLIMSASESEGSESESGTSCREDMAASHSKVKDSVHWNDDGGGSVRSIDDWNTGMMSSCIITPAKAPPTIEQLMETAHSIYGIPSVRNRKAFYSNPKDVQLPRDFGGTLYWVPSSMAYDLKEFSPLYESSLPEHNTLSHWRTVFAMCNAPTGHTQDKGPPNCHPDIRNGKSRHILYTAADHEGDVIGRAQFVSKSPCVITPAKHPPNPLSVKQWMTTQQFNKTHGEGIRTSRSLSDSSSLLEGPSLNNTFGFKVTPVTDTNTHVDANVQYITAMSIEVHVRTRLGLKPDPEWDPVLVIFYSIINDWEPDDVTEGLIAIDLSSNSINDFNSPSVKQNKISSIKKSPTHRSHAKLSPTHKSPAKLSPTHKSPAKPSPTHKSPAKPKTSPRKPQHKKSSRLAPIVSLKNFIASSQSSSSTSSSTYQRKDSDTCHPYLDRCGLSPSISITYVKNESELFDELVKLVRQVDPDFMVGYEMELSSLGYLRDRAAYLGINLLGQLARIPSSSKKQTRPTVSNTGSLGTEPHVAGRIVLNLWRIIKHELSLTSYTFENVSFHALHKRLPKFTHETLTEWYEHFNRLYRYRVIDYYTIRCQGNHTLIDKFNLIGRTSEMSRLYGIEFHSCLNRGTQYRVESMMLRLAKPANYIALSPSVYQRAKMAAPECVPLILEPESKFYTDPVLVLDFQSLYPSMIIGYNYCYSTCLGRVRHLQRCDTEYPFGTCSLSISTDELKRLKDDITISPNGIVFLKPRVREGILPRMLTEILDTRIMVKQSMKLHKNNKTLLKLLDARQLSLKLIANVTYGYTGASFSGRMPCAEIADSIVRKGRETLERAIDLIHSNPTWNAKVVYGDTDSVFVLLKGVSKDEAFKIGNEMCKAITKDNPKPIKLKFEKVYLPCLLQTKKRYVGYSYESADQQEPIYDAKGIETVRRDGCPAVGKMLEKSLRLLFTSYDLSLVKAYIQRQFTKTMKAQVSLQDFTFAKEYRGKDGYRPGACVPALELARQGMSVDRRSEPRAGERVPYVIVYGSPGLPLIELVRRPEELLTNPSLRLNAVYYITKQILPALDRALVVMGVDVFQWYNELPRINRPSVSIYQPLLTSSHKNTIGQYFSSIHCVICNEISSESVCKECLKNPRNVVMILSTDLHKVQHKYRTICQICENCCGYSDGSYYLECVSLDCPVIHARQTCLNYLYHKDIYLGIYHSLIKNI